jgi:hypothetical protein
MRNVLSWLLLLFGEVIIITAFVLFRGNLTDPILVMNIVVSSVIYGLFFLNFRAPWIDLKDKSQQRVGALGISWFSVWLYAFLAIATMVVANIFYILDFNIQLIIHCGLLFFLLLGLLLSQHAADQVKAVYDQEQSEDAKSYRKRIEALKNE